MIDINKKYRTTNGYHVTLISDQGRGGYPFLGYVKDSCSVQMWDDKGKNPRFKTLNLVEVPKADYTYFLVIGSQMVAVSGNRSIDRVLLAQPKREVLRVNTLAPYDTLLIREGDPLWPL